MAEDFNWNDEIAEPLNGDNVIAFGKHKGTKLDDVPAQYLLWCYEQDWFRRKYPEVHGYVESCLELLEEQASENSLSSTRPHEFDYDDYADGPF